MTDADYAYLLRTLSEARSRATEISVAVRSRVGAGHRLSELGDSAVTGIENLLRQVRKAATEEPQKGGADEVRPSAPIEIRPSPVQPEKAALPASSPEPISQHWFPAFVNQLVEQFGASGEISFEAVERALAARKEAFAKDLEVTERMCRTYPHLFKETETRSS